LLFKLIEAIFKRMKADLSHRAETDSATVPHRQLLLQMYPAGSISCVYKAEIDAEAVKSA
jgi:hypothetical protein